LPTLIRTSVPNSARSSFPTALAWKKFLETHDQPALHDRDQSHPTPAGTYLAASVFLAVLFGEPPTATDDEIAGLDQNDTSKLKEAARKICKVPSRPKKS